MGNGAENQIRMSLPEGASPEEVQRVLKIYKPYYTDHCQVKTRPYDGIWESLAILKEKYPIAVVSNKPDAAVKALCGQMFPGIFALGEAPDCPRKPAPDMASLRHSWQFSTVWISSTLIYGILAVARQLPQSSLYICLQNVWISRWK